MNLSTLFTLICTSFTKSKALKQRRGRGYENGCGVFGDCGPQYWHCISSSDYTSDSCIPGPFEPCCPLPPVPPIGSTDKYLLCRINFCETDPFKICACYGYEPVVVTEENLCRLLACLRNSKVTDRAAVVGHDDIEGEFVLSSDGSISVYDPTLNPVEYALCRKIILE